MSEVSLKVHMRIYSLSHADSIALYVNEITQGIVNWIGPPVQTNGDFDRCTCGSTRGGDPSTARSALSLSHTHSHTHTHNTHTHTHTGIIANAQIFFSPEP